MDDIPDYLRTQAQRFRRLAPFLSGNMQRRLVEEAEQAEAMAQRVDVLLDDLGRISRHARVARAAR